MTYSIIRRRSRARDIRMAKHRDMTPPLPDQLEGPRLAAFAMLCSRLWPWERTRERIDELYEDAGNIATEYLAAQHRARFPK